MVEQCFVERGPWFEQFQDPSLRVEGVLNPRDNPKPSFSLSLYIYIYLYVHIQIHIHACIPDQLLLRKSCWFELAIQVHPETMLNPILTPPRSWRTVHPKL